MRCTPKAPLRCWQYVQPGSEMIPLWVAKLVQFDGEKLTMPITNSEWTFEPGDWLVEFPGMEESTEATTPEYGLFNAKQFAARFDMVPAKLPPEPKKARQNERNEHGKAAKTA